jgi:small subunit ribosomal protein S2
MPVPEIKEMLEAGVHFGHLTKRWNPKMKKFILTEKNGIYVIDLSKTQECLSKAIEAVKRIRQSGKTILFVGTKKTIKDCMKEEAVRCGQYYVTERWLGGMLTNFSTVKKSIKRLEEIEKMETDGLFKEITKKEVLSLNKERAKLEGIFSGIRNMKSLPGALFVVDSEHEEIAVHEANRLKIPVIAIVDTNSDPDKVAFPIPGNDDAIKSVGLLTRVISDAIGAIATPIVDQEGKPDAAAPALAEVLEGAE